MFEFRIYLPRQFLVQFAHFWCAVVYAVAAGHNTAYPAEQKIGLVR